MTMEPDWLTSLEAERRARRTGRLAGAALGAAAALLVPMGVRLGLAAISAHAMASLAAAAGARAAQMQASCPAVRTTGAVANVPFVFDLERQLSLAGFGEPRYPPQPCAAARPGLPLVLPARVGLALPAAYRRERVELSVTLLQAGWEGNRLPRPLVRVTASEEAPLYLAGVLALPWRARVAATAAQAPASWPGVGKASLVLP
jgi:hypothetical protein